MSHATGELVADPPPTVVHLLASAAEESPGAEAVVFGEVRLTYAEYYERVRAFAHELLERGVAGRRVATVLGNSADTCIAFFAVHLAGAQLVPVNPLYTDRELRQILSDAEPVLVIADESLGARVARLAEEQGVEALLVGKDTRGLATAPAEPPVYDASELSLPEPDAPALLQYTGGSTGTPKGVQLTHRAIATNVAQREALLPTRCGEERVLCVMPLFHSYALSMALYLSAHSHGCLVVLPRHHPEHLLQTIRKERITLFPGNPTIYSGLLSHPAAATTDWSTVRACYSGSAPLPVETLRRWEALVGAPVVEGYGQTEAGPVLTFNPAEGTRKAGSVGVPVPGTTVQVVDLAAADVPLGPGQVGEIRARGPQIMSGYLNRPVETAESLRDGWLYTSDIGEFDDDGYLYIRERKKELVIVGGYNVYPREVEEVLFSHPDVIDAGVIGAPDDYRGEGLQAFVVLATGSAASAEELREHCRGRLAKYKVPTLVRLVQQLPKTSVNKTDKVALRQEMTS
ncbi:long-chain-fatty-acid--CoA ligase [Modestobacter lapidis]|nr:long-chain fatty acid--CoA ligase [Modestobacter lapidis]